MYPLLGHKRGSPLDVHWIWAARTVNCLVSFLMPYTLDHVCSRLQPQCCGQTKFNMESPWLRKWWSSKWCVQYFQKFSREGSSFCSGKLLSHSRLPEVLYTLWQRSGLWLPYLKTGEVRFWKGVWERGEGEGRRENDGIYLFWKLKWELFPGRKGAARGGGEDGRVRGGGESAVQYRECKSEQSTMIL